MSSLSPKPASELKAPELRLKRLDALRAELDRIDDALHDTLMRRAELVTHVGALGAKGRTPLRPGREASIIRRLLARNEGALAPATIVRLWRELLASSSAQQNPMAVAVGDAGLLALAREHFGALTPVAVDTPAQVAEDVRSGRATVAVLPLPGGRERWWTTLLDQSRPRLHIVARLPFWARASSAEGVVLSAAAPDPSGGDRSLIASSHSEGDFGAMLTAAGFEPGAVVAVQDDSSNIVLADVAGFVAEDDLRLATIKTPARPLVIGAYATPVGDFE